jgi:hypothetical protein
MPWLDWRIIISLNMKTDQYTYGIYQLQNPVQITHSFARSNKLRVQWQEKISSIILAIFKFCARIVLCRVSYMVVHSTYLLFSVKSQFVINAERDLALLHSLRLTTDNHTRNFCLNGQPTITSLIIHS